MFKAAVISAIILMLTGTILDIIGFVYENNVLSIIVLLISSTLKVAAVLCAVFALDISKRQK